MIIFSELIRTKASVRVIKSNLEVGPTVGDSYFRALPLWCTTSGLVWPQGVHLRAR